MTYLNFDILEIEFNIVYYENMNTYFYKDF